MGCGGGPGRGVGAKGRRRELCVWGGGFVGG